MYILTTKVVVDTPPIDWKMAHSKNSAIPDQPVSSWEITAKNSPAIAMVTTAKRTGFRPILEPK